MKKALLLAILLIPSIGFSQSFYAIQRPRNLALSGGIGSSLYFGELTKSAPADFIKLLSKNKTRYTVVGSAEYFFLRRFSIKSELSIFRLSETDLSAEDDSRSRNLSFKSTNTELSIVGVVNLLPLPLRFDNRFIINLHAFAGIGWFTLGPKTTFDGKTYDLRQYRTEGQKEKYSWISTAIPVGVGMRIKTTATTSLVLEAGYRYTFTDYIDDISGIQDPNVATKGRYPSAQQLGNDPIRIALSDRRTEYNPNFVVQPNVGVRGNPQSNDGYFLFNAKIEYYLPTYLGNPNRAEKKLRNIRINKEPSRKK